MTYFDNWPGLVNMTLPVKSQATISSPSEPPISLPLLYYICRKKEHREQQHVNISQHIPAIDRRIVYDRKSSVLAMSYDAAPYEKVRRLAKRGQLGALLGYHIYTSCLPMVKCVCSSPTYKNYYHQNSFFVHTVRDWNGLPNSTVTASTVNAFRVRLTRHTSAE